MQTRFDVIGGYNHDLFQLTPIGNRRMENHTPWYQRKRWVIGGLIIFPLVGIPLLWMSPWKRSTKIGITTAWVLLAVASALIEVATTSPPVVTSPEPVETIQPVQTVTPTPSLKTDEEEFIDTLVSATPGLLAKEQMGLVAPGWYDSRDQLWLAVEGLTIEDAETLTRRELEKIAYENGLPWDDEILNNMSEGLIRGLYEWETK